MEVTDFEILLNDVTFFMCFNMFQRGIYNVLIQFFKYSGGVGVIPGFQRLIGFIVESMCQYI